MNNGRICVSISAETATEFLENIERAEKLADVVELRFDYLKKEELKRALLATVARIGEKPFIATFRRKAEGGRRDLTVRERVEFWEQLFALNRRKNLLVDIEWDLRSILNLKTTASIVSLHDFSGTPANLSTSYEIFRRITDADILKFAVRTDDINDSIAVWKLLESAKTDGKRLVPIAMGESGRWTRILGLAHGAPLAYAALEAGRETASGQFTAHDLSEVYRVKQLSERTEIYGVVGNSVAQSLSPFMHNAAFKSHDLDAVYIGFAVKNLDEFIEKFVRESTREIDLNFKGFSVTIPHKQSVIKHLGFIDETAREIGAVNTVKIDDGKLYGFNTDADGFIEPLQTAYGDLRAAKIGIFGGGGAARACIYALKKAGAAITVFARDAEKANAINENFGVETKEFKQKDFNDFDVLVNATPLGTSGELERETPAVARQIEGVKMIYDLVYSPFETAFIKEARKVNVPTLGGLAMLVAQGARQFEIWTGKTAPLKEMGAAALGRINN